MPDIDVYESLVLFVYKTYSYPKTEVPGAKYINAKHPSTATNNIPIINAK